MSTSTKPKRERALSTKRLALVNNGGLPPDVKSYYALISHQELDGLVGRLMQMCDLMGDQEQRQALKSEIKQRCREWLDSEYEMAGYDRFEGLQDYAQKPVTD